MKNKILLIIFIFILSFAFFISCPDTPPSEAQLFLSTKYKTTYDLIDIGITTGNVVNIGKVFSSRDIIFMIQNWGGVDLNLNGLTITGNSEFSISSFPTASVLKYHEITYFTIKFSSHESSGTKKATIELKSNSSHDPDKIFTICGDVQTAVLSDTPKLIMWYENPTPANQYINNNDTSLDIGNVYAMSVSQDKKELQVQFNLLNDGFKDLKITSVSLASGNDPEISIKNNVIYDTIMPGYYDNLEIKFQAISALNTGLKKATIHVITNDPVNPDFTFQIVGRVYQGMLTIPGN